MKLAIYEFGQQLLVKNDLDPVYVILYQAGFEREKLKKWLLAYWCFYHVGTASWITDQPDYWKAMETAAGSKEWPRSSERRHFRGNNAIQSVAYLKDKGVTRLFWPFTTKSEVPVHRVMAYVQEWVGFGPWIAFKVADMVERLGICKVSFDAGAMFLFDSPRKASEMLYEAERGEKAKSIEEAGTYAVNAILERLGESLAPPSGNRRINVQEAETILCKWKSYLSGYYEIGEDIEAVKRVLLRFSRCRTSQDLYQAGKKGKLWR